MRTSSSGQGSLIRIRPRLDRVEISRGRTSFVSEHDGRTKKEIPVEGLYVYNTRILSRYDWLMNGKKPKFSCGSQIEQFSWMGYYVQAPENCKETPAEECDPLQETVELRITRSVGEGMHEEVRLTNHTQIAKSVRLEIDYELEFVARSEVEKGRKQQGQAPLEISRLADLRAACFVSQEANGEAYGNFGSPGRARTCNPSVNSRMLYH